VVAKVVLAMGTMTRADTMAASPQYASETTRANQDRYVSTYHKLMHMLTSVYHDE
jgi:hypothetical protein